MDWTLLKSYFWVLFKGPFWRWYEFEKSHARKYHATQIPKEGQKNFTILQKGHFLLNCIATRTGVETMGDGKIINFWLPLA